MGDRMIISVVCPECNTIADDVYYAPTCDFTTYTCEACGHIIDLEEYTGYSYEDMSNIDTLKEVVEAFKEVVEDGDGQIPENA